MKVEGKRVLASDGPLFGSSGERKEVEGGVGLLVRLGGVSRNCRFVIVDAPSSYNVIFGRPLISAFRCVPSSYHQCLKFNNGGVQVRIRGDPKMARQCYVTTVNTVSWMAEAEELEKEMAEQEGVEEGEISPGEAMEVVEEMAEVEEERMRACIQSNVDIFAWRATDMPGINADVACHRLNLDPRARRIRQKMRAIATKLEAPIREEVKKLLDAGFISEIQYPGWISNVVMVKKGGGKWRMCIDFSLLNKSCPKDCYPLPRIDALVDSAVGFSLMSFLDAFSGYHHIRMHPPDVKDVSFITREGCFSYKMMPFGLKNAGATYQRMMDRIFRDQRGRNLEVYVDDLMVKSKCVDSHLRDLEETFATLRRFKMRLNPLKCVFGASRGKFLGHLLTLAGVEPSPDKVKAILDLESPRSAKEVQRLTGKLAGLSRFLSRSGDRCSSFFKVLRGNQVFEWTAKLEEAFQGLKRQLSQAPLLQRPKEGEDLALYLGVGVEAVSSILVREEGKKLLPVYYVSRILKKAEI
ncbi:hypothetical protein KSP39_PZI001154 [Platanthera zijinensis]|uniref:Reverse transcriptase domain-containing protein n=1 Tax=Platanthera zijinensis TaxID=2320716 RepID=A0AAP0GFS2_9ASPA